MAKITARTVSAAKAEPDKDVVLWDDDMPGFGLRIKPSGVKSYIIQYRNAARQSRRYTLGRASVLTAEQARSLAKSKLADVTRGSDPAAEREGSIREPTVRELAERFDREHIGRKTKPNTAREYRRVLIDVIVPALGSRRVSSITRREVEDLHDRLIETPSHANKVLAVISKMMTLAEKWEYRSPATNPCRFIEKFPENKRQRYLSTDEFGRLGAALREMEDSGEITPFVALLFSLVVHTGCRVSEILTLRWGYVDLEYGLLNLPDSKTGQKHVKLSSVAVDLLRQAPRVEGCPWVIVGRRRNSGGEWTHHANPSKAWGRVRQRAKLEDCHIHDLRHSFTTEGVGLGLGPLLVGGLICVTQQTLARYAHVAPGPLKDGADLIGATIAAKMSGYQ